MKIGVYLDDYVPQDGGGYIFQAEVFAALCRLASESQHEFVIMSTPSKEIETRLKSTNLQWLICPSPNLLEKISAFFTRNWANLGARWHWQSSMERRAHQAGIEFVWFVGPRAKMIYLPYMMIVLDLQHRLQPWFPEVSAFGEWLVRERHYASVLPRASAIIAGTQAGKEEIVRFYQVPAERIHILPHPTPGYALSAKAANDDEILARHGLKPGYLFYPAQFWAHKNHVNLLLALKQLSKSGLKIRLVLSGADFGNLAYVKDQIRKLELQEQVRLIGFVPQGDLPALYRGALALTYVSFFGPENMPPLEAFAFGCPVIAANVSGAEEQMDGCALLINPADPTEIAAAIRNLASDGNLRERLVASGHQRAQRWTTEDFVRGAFGVLDSFEAIRRTWKN